MSEQVELKTEEVGDVAQPPEQQERQLGEDPFGVAATMFGIYTPRLEAIIKGMSSKDLRRLITVMITYPFNEKEVLRAGSSKMLKEAASIGQRLMEAKTMMIIKGLYDQEAKLRAAEAESVKQSQSEEGGANG